MSIKANPEKLKKFQLPRSYTIDCIEIDLIGNDTRKYSNNEKKNVKVVARQQSNQKLEPHLEETESSSSTNKHKWFFSFIFTVLVVSIVVLIVALVKSKKDDVCLSSACIRTAALSLQYMDVHVNPCNNFYNFACGYYGADLSQSEPNINTFDKTENLVKHQLMSTLTESLSKNASTFLLPLHKLYGMCKNNRVNIPDEIEYLNRLLLILGGWPMIVGHLWNENSNDFTRLTISLRLNGVPYNIFFKVGVNINADNDTHYQLLISSTDLYTPSDFEQKVEYLATLLGGNETVIQRDLKDVVLFKSELEKVLKKTAQTNKVMTIKEFQKQIPDIDWLWYINKLVHFEIFPELTVTEDVVIRLTVLGMNDLIKLIINTSSRTIFNYVISIVVIYYAETTLENSYFPYNSIKQIENLQKSFSLPMNYLYVQKYFNKDIENAVQDIVSNIKINFIESLKNAEWFDESTRKLTLEKINSMNFIIGYPKELLNLTILDSYYRQLDIQSGKCFQAITTVNKFNYNNYFKKLITPLAKDWELLGTNVTSNYVYYNSGLNYLFIPAALIVNAVYDNQAPNYINFATLGFTVGHQLTLALHKQVKEWSSESRKKYREKTQCMEDQYRKVFNNSIISDITLSTNVADSGGLKQAYNAYQLWLKRNDKEHKMPGLNFSNNQMFWFSFAQLWCEKKTEPNTKEVSIHDSHPPGSFRVLETLKNLVNFSMDFKCSITSHMNPFEKCTVWKTSYQNSKKRKLFYVLALVTLILSVILLIVAATTFNRNDICLSRACIRTSALSLQHMDPTVDPCINFYNFACGKYGIDLRLTESSNNAFDNEYYLNLNEDNIILFQPLSKNDSKFILYLKEFHSLCTRNHEINVKTDIKYLKIYMMNFDAWPMINLNKKIDYNFIELTSLLRKYGAPYNHFFKVDVNINPSNQTKYQLFISCIEDDVYLPSEFEKNVKDLAFLLGGIEATVRKDLSDVMLLKNELDKILKKTAKTNEAITVKELQTKIPDIDWIRYLNLIIGVPDLKIDENEVVRLTTSVLEEFVKLVFRTPKRTVINYILSNVALYALNYFPSLGIHHFGINPNQYLEITRNSMPLVGNYMYVKKYFNKNMENEVQKIVSHIKQEFLKSIETADWVDDITKKYAIKKLNAMSVIIGYPKELLNLNIFETYYRTMDDDVDSCFEVVIKANQLNADKQFRKLKLPISDDWEILGVSVTLKNVIYSRGANYIFIPAALIVDMMNNKPRLNYVNYAILGFNIGRELAYAFDDKGIRYGFDGKTIEWWSPGIDKIFAEKTQCLLEKYKNFIILNRLINDSININQEIAVRGGLKQAYQAWLRRYDTEEKLPGLKFTQNQIFWITYAQSLCNRASIDNFTKFQVQETVSNIESFSKDFNCSLGLPMNPVQKCTVW
ncbi:hypothetical protein FQR65_LT06966 [Abscondita terminalis]|nr:hypothetical protein FQR65_LT06966 [Abscondita terminalis]